MSIGSRSLPSGVECDVEFVCGQRQLRVAHQPVLQIGALLLGGLEADARREYQLLTLLRHPRDQQMDLALRFVLRKIRGSQ